LGLPTGLLTGVGRDAKAASLAATACYCLLHIRPEADDELPSGIIVLCALPFGAT